MSSLSPKVVTVIPANQTLTANQNSEKPINVAAYCRVSTDEDDQINSYNTQKMYYKEKIMKNPKWRFVDIYADEGITGTLTKKRDGFLKMIKDCENGKIDLILTKSVSRYARNVVDSLSYIRKLKAMGIGIFFEEQNINSLTEESETYIGIYSVIAQSESENISGNVKWGIQKRMQSGSYSTSFDLLGYRRDDETGDPYIIPEEAEVVKKIYGMYLDGMSVLQIKKCLESSGEKTHKGSCVWNTSSIRTILKNEKYCGDVIFQKTFRLDPISKRVIINRGQKDKYLVSNNHPAIIDRDVFMAVQAEILRRSSKSKTSDRTKTFMGKYSGKYALSELSVCGCCGSPYKRSIWTKKGYHKRVYWRCQSRMEHGNKFCKDSHGIREEDLHNAICRALQKGVDCCEESYSLIKSNLKYAITGSDKAFNVQSIEDALQKKKKELSNLSRLLMTNEGNKDKFDESINTICSEISVLRQQLEYANQQLNNEIAADEKIQKAIKWLDHNPIQFDSYDDIVVRRLVEVIRINPDRTITVSLKGGKKIDELI